ncbi:hypothetical protein RFI_19201 [Reticulomyxa filosa]|uniref:non-specific serine/threonine protein kinase n=1 Tax=Reticulomyxa filosa TaxID=46433 RepID=X6MVR4_RETFI|nr:hypothetical protein RFI_19201 [Reticulomyxa filosa]|eukprot:ETO18088.1 hypothetical protein RFI_19201 [Reticulomyxa filosa]
MNKQNNNNNYNGDDLMQNSPIEASVTFTEVKDGIDMHVKIFDWAQLTLDDTDPRSLLGTGTSGAVIMGTYKGKPVAIKAITCRELDLSLDVVHVFNKEAILCQNLQHKNIVQFLGVAIQPPQLCLIFEYCSHRSLLHVLRDVNTYPFSFDLVLHIALDIAEGMNFLHNNGIVHRDLKPDNILMEYDKTEQRLFAKVCDFGVSRMVGNWSDSQKSGHLLSIFDPKEDRKKQARASTTSQASTVETRRGGPVGTPTYMSPEILKNWHLPHGGSALASSYTSWTNIQYSFPVDVFSYGLILWELVMRDQVYGNEAKNVFQIRQAVLEGKRPKIPQFIPDEYSSLMSDCWQHTPEKRPNFRQVVQRLRDVLELPKPSRKKNSIILCVPTVHELLEGSEQENPCSTPYLTPLTQFDSSLNGTE